MMAIPDKNETIYQVIYTSITYASNFKALKEFGFYNYFICPGENNCKYILIIIIIYSTYNGLLSEGF